MTSFISTILVPQGAEYQAVCRGLQGKTATPTVLPIPVGSAALTRHLQQLHQQRPFQAQAILVLGLCGGLDPALGVGDRVLYQGCLATDRPLLPCDLDLTAKIATLLALQPVPAWTSDRVIWSRQEKLALVDRGAVVDMEGYGLLEFFRQTDCALATLRVVSDDTGGDIPDLSTAFDADGNLQPLPLAWGMVRRPGAALRLVRGSLTGLKALQAVTSQLFATS